MLRPVNTSIFINASFFLMIKPVIKEVALINKTGIASTSPLGYHPVHIAVPGIRKDRIERRKAPSAQ
jgi:hypothetical protein